MLNKTTLTTLISSVTLFSLTMLNKKRRAPTGQIWTHSEIVAQLNNNNYLMTLPDYPWKWSCKQVKPESKVNLVYKYKPHSPWMR